MLEKLPPEADLFESALPAELAGRPRLHVHVVVVEVARPPRRLRRARRFLVVDVRHHLLAERAVVEPVVAHPAVHHRVHRHRHLQRRVRVHQRHQRQEPVVGDADDADLAVALGNVLHQPVDGVVGVGRVVDRRRVLRTTQWTVHDVVPFGPVFPADVLDNADVASLDNDVGRVVVAGQDRAEVRAFGVAGQGRGVVRGARQQDGRALCALGHEDHGVQPDAVPHRDHHVAPGVVESECRRLEFLRRFAGERGVCGRPLRDALRRGRADVRQCAEHRDEQGANDAGRCGDEGHGTPPGGSETKHRHGLSGRRAAARAGRSGGITLSLSQCDPASRDPIASARRSDRRC